MFEIRIQDQRINAYRLIKGHTRQDVELKAAAQIAVWNEKAKRKQEKADLQARRLASVSDHWQAAQEAEALTEEASSAVSALEGLLLALLSQPVPSWKDLKDHSNFAEQMPARPKQRENPPPPSLAAYQLKLTIMDKLIPSRRKKKESQAVDDFSAAMRLWDQTCQSIRAANEALNEQYAKDEGDWEEKRRQFDLTQKASNAAIDSLRIAYVEGIGEAIEFKANETLARTHLPDGFPQGSEVSYDPANRTLIVDFELTDIAVLPEYREAKYVRSRSEVTFKPFSETWKKATYDAVLYQAALGLIHRLFTADDKDWIYSVVFNGWVRSIDKSTGADAHGCILSLQVGRDEFLPLDLRRVDPKACFRSLKGVASSRLSELTPIKPIQQLNKQDSRFVAGYSVANGIDERTNLAAMDWQDFENLIREVFEKEFARNGGEVKITQASRDGGVDAVAFDPDPIRGGKIVIQAKRYTNTVGVSAVRDLYGTVQHEGAMKGILVTTAAYGSDAYEFAKDKPITLISGGELLTILDRHGHTAKIDLREARALRI